MSKRGPDNRLSMICDEEEIERRSKSCTRTAKGINININNNNLI